MPADWPDCHEHCQDLVLMPRCGRKLFHKRGRVLLTIGDDGDQTGMLLRLHSGHAAF